ncbi:MAG: four helix bundle protein [Bacteroidetes bacterium]|nr:MAG: four helix bundle protein [Bacteroidota bacterium]
MMKNDLLERLFDFAIRVIKFLRTLPDNPETKIIRYQLIKCSTSTGANYEEAQAGSSKADFTNKVRISLREMRESNYWLRVIAALEFNNINQKELEWLVNESKELKLILGSIVQKSRL